MRKAKGRAGHQATQFTAALMAGVMVVLMVNNRGDNNFYGELVMKEDGDSGDSQKGRREGWTCRHQAIQFTAALTD